MENKYKMTIEDNVIWAKRNIVDTIYKNARLEGVAVTFPQTQALLSGATVNLSPLVIEKILNMKHAWEFLITTIDLPENYAYFCQLHRYVANELGIYAGKIRSTPVAMGGTSWTQSLPIESIIKEEMKELAKIANPTDRAITSMLWGMRRQMFLDGNKRVSMLYANKILINNGCGVLSVPTEDLEDFGEKLVQFYETGNMEEIKNFVYQNCITGFDSIQKECILDEDPAIEI